MHSPAPAARFLLPGNNRLQQIRIAAWASVVFAVLSITCAVKSPGFIAGDACMHYLAARYAFETPRNFVDVWNRPAVTLLYCIPAALGGRGAVRLTAMWVAIACAAVAGKIAAGQGAGRPALAVLFTLGQPLLFLHSFGEMTELPFALLLGLTFLAWQNRRWSLATALAGWLPLARPEGFGFALIWFCFLLMQRKWRLPALMLAPLLLWDLAGWELTGRASPWYRWLLDNWPYAGKSLYPRGSPFTFLAALPAVASPAAMPFLWLGICRKLIGGDTANPQGRAAARWLTAVIPLFVLAVHSLLYALGKMASFGEARYLLVAAPFWGVLAAAGWEWTFNRFHWRRPVPWAAVALLAPPMVANALHPVVPVPLQHDWQSAKAIVDWYRAGDIQASHPKLMAAHPGIFYFLSVNPYASPRLRGWDQATLQARPGDTILIWDPIYGSRNASSTYALTLQQIQQAGWREIPAPPLREDASEPLRTAQIPPGDPTLAWHIFVGD